MAQPTLHPDSTFHRLQEPQDPRNLHGPCHAVPTESPGCSPFHCNLSAWLSASLPSLLSISYLCFPLPSPQSSSLFLGFHLKEERAKNPVPGSSAGVQGKALTLTHTQGPSWLLMTPLHPWSRAAGKAQLSELCFHKVMEEIKRPKWNFQELTRKKRNEIKCAWSYPVDHLEG